MPSRLDAPLTALSAEHHHNVSPLRRVRERDLVRLFQCEPSAREAVVAAYRPLAMRLARRYHRGEEPLEDLEQVALVGLLKALRGFDCERGAPFVPYAVPTITGELRRHYRDNGWAVHVPRSAKDLSGRITQLEREAAARLPIEQLAERLGVSAEQVVEARLAAGAMRACSLDAPEADGDRPRHQTAVEDRGFAAAEDRVDVDRLIAGLPPRERRILRLRFEFGLSQTEIGERVGLSQMQVSRILRRILDDLAQAGPPYAGTGSSTTLVQPESRRSKAS